MGVAGKAEYEAAIRKLFPKGEYWERQFADPESDVSLFCKAKLPALITFRKRMEALRHESVPETTEELVSDWERVLLDSVFPNMTLLQRRLQLRAMWNTRLNRAKLEEIAVMFDLHIADVYFPYRPAFFGFSSVRSSYIGSPVTFSVLFLRVQEEHFREKSWALIKPDYPAKRLGRMRVGIDRLIYFPIYQLRLYVYAKVRESAAGFFKCGIDRMFPVTIRLHTEELAAKRLSRIRFGIHRIVYFPFQRLRLTTSGFSET